MEKKFFVPKLKESPEKPEKETEEKVGYVPGGEEVEIDGLTKEEIEKVKKEAAPSEKEKEEAEKERKFWEKKKKGE